MPYNSSKEAGAFSQSTSRAKPYVSSVSASVPCLIRA